MTRYSVLGLLLVFNQFLTASYLGSEEEYSEKKMVRPVDTDKSMDRSSFKADYDQVWQLLDDILTEYGFKYRFKDKSIGRLETGYVIFSRDPHFSKISNGFKAFAHPPRVFLKKWDDGKMKIFAEVHQVSDNSVQVVVHPDIYGFAASLMDDSSVTGEWKQCQSNGKFEFEVFNEIATRLRKGPVVESSASPTSHATEENAETRPIEEGVQDSNVFVNSVPEGAEILLNNQLVGMTPSRLSLKPGTYEVILQKEGYKKFSRQFVVMHGSDLTISTELKEN
jgi:hypothetical protein